MNNYRVEKDSFGEMKVPIEKLWGAHTQRSLQNFNSGDNLFSDDLFPTGMIKAYAIIKKACAIVNHRFGLLSELEKNLITKACDEIYSGQLDEHFPLHVWMTGSGTQLNMNINEVICNRVYQLEGKLITLHPNDHVNMSQSSNDTFPTAMYIISAIGTHERVIPNVEKLRDALAKKANEWKDIIKIGRTHLQDATPITLGQEFSGYVGMLDDNVKWLKQSLESVYQLALGGTAVGTGINTPKGFDIAVAKQIADLTGLPFITAPNKFTVQGSHDALVQLSGTFKTLANSLLKIVNDIRFLSCGPRCGIGEIHIPANEPGSSIMPGKVNPTQCEALAMISLQIIANDLAVTLGGSSGFLEMNVCKPLIITNILKSIRLIQDGCHNFRLFLVEGMTPNHKQIDNFLHRSLMLVTALSPLIGYDKSAKIAHYALDYDLTLREAALKLGYVTADQFDTLIDPKKMI